MRGSLSRLLPVVVALSCVISVAGCASSTPKAAQPASSVSPADLKGVWLGTWNNQHLSGSMRLTVHEQNGSRITGEQFLSGAASVGQYSGAFTGQVEGNKLTTTMVTDPTKGGEYVVSGDEMSGSGRSSGGVAHLKRQRLSASGLGQAPTAAAGASSVWLGTWRNAGLVGPLRMTLQRDGSKVSGEVFASGATGAGAFNGAFTGEMVGNQLKYTMMSDPTRGADFTMTGDRMSGVGRTTGAIMELERQK
jgi:hypothetical protein